MSGTHTSATRVGSLVLGRYRIVRQLAAGGMGVVYLARAEGAEGFVKPAVVKQILPGLDADSTATAMFVREARILSHLRHPSIVNVLDFGEADSGYVMVLEYVHGYTLAQWARFLRKTDRQVPTEIMLHIAVQVLDALHYVHTQTGPDGTPLHITHRDVSPTNILLDATGRVRLLDFGVARIDGATTGYKTTGAGFRGKLPFTAPEIFDGADAGPQTDLYATAVMVHSILCSKNCFIGRTEAETISRVTKFVPPPVASVRLDVPEGLDQVLARALAKNPAERYATAVEFSAALNEVIERTPEALTSGLSGLLGADFNDEMAELLGVDSLTTLDRAWRHFSDWPGAPEGEPTASDDAAIEHSTVRNDDITGPGEDASAVRPVRGETSGTHRSPKRAPDRELHPTVRVAPAQGRARWWVAAAVAGFGLLLGAQFSGTPQPKIVLVQSQAFPEGSPTPARQPAGQQPGVAPATPREQPQGAASQQGGVAGITAAFRTRQSAVTACFASHPLPDRRRLDIRFDLRADGSVASAVISPRALRDTGLGECLRDVARETTFPPQAGPVSLRIPVFAERISAPGAAD